MVQILNPVPNSKTLRQQAFQEGLDRAMSGVGQLYAENLQKQKTKRQQAFENIQNAVALRNKGYDVTPEQLEQINQQNSGGLSSIFSEEKPVDYSGVLSKRTPEYEQGIRDKQVEREIQLQRLKNLKSGKYSAGGGKPAPISGYSQVDESVKVTPQDVEAVKKSDTATKNVVDRVNSLAEKIKKFGFSSGLGLTKADIAIDSDLSDLRLEMKELADLGAIAGPDLDLVNESLGVLSGPIDKLNPLISREDAIEQLKEVANKAINRSKNIAETRGLKRTSKAPQFIDPYKKKVNDQIKSLSREEKIRILEGR